VPEAHITIVRAVANARVMVEGGLDRVSEAAQYARSLIEVSLNPLVSIDPRGRITDVNAAAEEATGIPRDQLIGTDFADCFSEPEKARAAYQRVLAQGLLSDYPLVLRHVSGVLTDVEYNAAVYRDDSGELQAVFAAARDVSEARQSRLQVARLATIVASSQYAVFSRDLDGTITSWNAAAEALYGYAAEEAIGCNGTILIPPGHEGETQGLIRRMLRGDRGFGSETQRLCKDGSLLDVAFTLSPVRDAAGDITALSITDHDISARVRTERMLRESEEKFSAAFQASPDLMVISKLSDGTLLEVNDGFTQLRGFARAEAVGKSTTELAIWADPADRTAFVASLEKSGHASAHDTTLRRKDGTLVTGIESARTFELKGETCVLWVFHDITERKQAEEALRASETHLRTLIDTLPDLVWLKDLEGVYVSCNRRFESFFGAAVEDIVGKTDYDFTDADQADSFRHHDAAAMAAEDPTVNEEEIVFAADGHREILETIKTPVHAGDGRLIGILGVGRDITARKLMEEALRESEERHRDILEYGGVGVAYFSLDGHFLLLNRRAVQNMGGGQASEFVGKSVTELFGEADGRKYLERIREAAASPEAHEYVDYVELPSGPHWLSSIHTRSLDAAGNAAGVQIYAQDITERKQAEEEVLLHAEQLQRTVEGAVLAMGHMVESRDPYTAGHERRVADLATAIGAEMGMKGEQLEALRLAGTIHDVGKIAIPAEILSKPGRLNKIEFELIKGHPTTGFDILADVDFGAPVAEIVLQHHERLDGSGYPRALKGADIMPEARILAVADVVEAMSSHRPYRPALGIEAALTEVRGHAGVKYDADVVAVCGRLFEEQDFEFTP
jgi:PAS domain S-box-containing protein